ncbi:hypothetical protein [Kribbella sindirgiensis]|uniref:Peptidoglycan-binding protein n=1 Tax=Kribbella sindirgiensis TaxID=1124744 RepID=A0A4R0ILT2_9ACTN|nr:hypothetical protein [Kribbella sindirgiensis]TCC32158.1 hypothetical protein E0H50_18190 [Kribbella sindirgiensis]
MTPRWHGRSTILPVPGAHHPSSLVAFTVLFGGSVVAGPASAATASCRQNIYGLGGTGSCVKAIQSLANVLSISNSARAANHPNTKIDGWVGAQTWTILCYYGAFWGHDTKARDAYRWAKSYAC